MNAKRKEVESYILKYMAKMDKSGTNVEKYQKMFADMDDKAFNTWMENLKNHKDVLVFWIPAMKVNPRVKDLLSICKELNIELFHRLKLWDPPTQSYFLTPLKFLVVDIPCRRMSQYVDHKLSVPEGDSKIDLLTGQVMKPDQAGSISQTEIQALYARGLTKTIKELLKYRGGDVTAFAEYKRQLEEQGSTTISQETGSVPRSAVVLDSLFEGIMIQSNASGGAY